MDSPSAVFWSVDCFFRMEIVEYLPGEETYGGIEAATRGVILNEKIGLKGKEQLSVWKIGRETG